MSCQCTYVFLYYLSKCGK